MLAFAIPFNLSLVFKGSWHLVLLFLVGTLVLTQCYLLVDGDAGSRTGTAGPVRDVGRVAVAGDEFDRSQTRPYSCRRQRRFSCNSSQTFFTNRALYARAV